MRSQMLAKSPKAARADLLFAGVLHDPALEIVLTEVPGDLGAWVSTKCFNPAKFVDDEVVWRDFCCPGCGVRLATEVAYPGEAPFHELRLD